jgi:hypothetical protein
VEKVSFGKIYEFHIGTKKYDSLKKYWPGFLPKLPVLEYQSMKYGSSVEGMYTLYSEKDAAKMYVEPNLITFIEDEHGCVFPDPTGQSTIDFGQGKMKVIPIPHPIFPRRQKEFKMVVAKWPGKGPKAIPPVTLTIPNPKVVSPVQWIPEKIPIVKQGGDFKLVLERVDTVYKPRTPYSTEKDTIKSLKGEFRFMPHFKVEQNEDPNRTWIWISTNYFDATGNMHKSFLCPHEPALLMKVQLESRAFAGFDTNGLWTTAEIKVPAPGTFTLVPESATLGGVTIWTGMLAGPGVVTYSNGVPIKAIEDSTELPHLLVTPMDVGVGGANYASSKSSCWILGIGISGLKHMHDLIIFAIDDQGEKTKAGDFIKQPGGLVFSESLDSRGRPRGYIEAVNTYKSAKFITLPLNKKAKTIRLSMGIHCCRKFGMEFLFKPAGSVQMMSEETDDQSNTKIYGHPIKEFRHVCAEMDP